VHTEDMRLLLVWVAASLALASALPVDQEEEDEVKAVEVEVEDDTDLAQMLQGFFIGDRQGRDLEAGSEAPALNTEVLLQKDEEAAEDEQETADAVKEVDPAEILRFNNYMDAIFRRMNAALRAKLMDPMVLNLKKESKNADKEEEEEDHKAKKGKKNKKNGHNIVERAAPEDDEEEAEEETKMAKKKDDEDEVEGENEDAGEDRKMKEGKGKGGKAGKGKKNKKNKNKKKKEKKNNNKERSGDAADEEAKKAKKEERQRKKAEKQAREEKAMKGDNNMEKELARERRNKNSDKEKKNHKKGGGAKKKGREQPEKAGKAMGSLSGIATLRREGDVEILSADSHKIITAAFSVGPLQLEVSKSSGGGKARTVRSAMATTDAMKGKMTLKVKPDGSAHVKKVSFQKPDKVDVKGSLTDQKKRSDSYVKATVNKIRPFAAQRILKMARYVLKTPTVQRS